MDLAIAFYILLFVVAFLYSSVGHGGASGYLALMAIFSVAPEVMKPTALLLNLFVSLTAFVQYYRGGHFKWSIFWPIALCSVPFAYLGGLITLDAGIYKKILGLLLLFPIARFIFFRNTRVEEIKPAKPLLSGTMGAGIGWLSGLIGIGGGIILSPILLLFKWTDQKQTAAISAMFIFVNSASGLAGQLSKGVQFTPDMVVWVTIAFIGGLAGAYFGALKFNQNILKYSLATVLLMASFKLIFTAA